MVLDYVVPTPMGTTWGMCFMLELFSVLALLTLKDHILLCGLLWGLEGGNIGQQG